MICPSCGYEVDIYGSSWECGWCGDFGRLEIIELPEPPQITLNITLSGSSVRHVDLKETWYALKEALNRLAPEQAPLSQLLGKVLLHSISAGIWHAGALPDEKKAEELRAFLSTTPDLQLGEPAEELMRDAGQRVLFCEEAALSENDCGTFWAELISARPAEEYYNSIEPDGLHDLLSGLSSAYTYFSEKMDEETGKAHEYRTALHEAYHSQRENRVLLHPDLERAKRLLSEGEFPVNEDICREILLARYPKEVPHETAEIFDDLTWESILDDVFARDTAKGIEMWRSLLDAAEPVLKDDPDTAEMLFPVCDWLNLPQPDQASPLLLALKDGRFVSQLFGSASIGKLQLDALNACHDCGQEELGRQCLKTVLQNPYLDENWEKRFRLVFAAAAASGRSKQRAHQARNPAADTKTVLRVIDAPISEQPKEEPQITESAALEKGDENPAPKKKPLPSGKLIAAVLAVAVIAGIALGVSSHNRQSAATYAEPPRPLTQRSLSPAAEAELERIAAEDAEKRARGMEYKYSGKLPADGMPVSCLKYTSLGSPTETEKCQFYDNMDVHRRYKILHWYNSEGQTVAYCHSHQPKGETEEIIYAFSYYEPPAGRPTPAPAGTTPGTSGSGNSGSIRDDYDDPEDLWEDNRDWFDDEDEAWDEWYDD